MLTFAEIQNSQGIQKIAYPQIQMIPIFDYYYATELSIELLPSHQINLNLKDFFNLFNKLFMKILNGIILTVFAFCFALTSCKSEKNKWELKSPDGKIEVVINSDISDPNSQNQLYYQLLITKEGVMQSAISQSPLGIVREDADFSRNLTFLNSLYSENVKIQYQLISGKSRQCSNVYNEIILEFQNAEGKQLAFIFRAFNNGIAYCYKFPIAENNNVTILNEKSGFNIPGATAWMHPYDTVTKYTPAYETFYEGPMSSGTPAPKGKNGWAFPALFETANHQWVLISESDLDGNYVASHLDVEGNEGLYLLKNPIQTEGMGLFKTSSEVQLPFQTPWRVIIAGNELSAILESNLITDLASENKLGNTDWIKPGRAGWSWWYDNDSPKDYSRMLPYIDFAAKMGWEYFLVDANWNMMKNGSMEQLSKYASEKGVGLLLWYNSGGKHNEVSEAPRDLMFDREIRRKEFQRIHELGVKGVKVDFFQSDKQDIINQYIEILEDAAEFQILVNFHGCTLPKGWSRTYPNLVSTEAIRGAESYLFDPLYPERAPVHIATIPFTRGVVGPTDYTPCGFSDKKYPHITSNGFEIALPIIIESGITHFVDAPEVYSAMPQYVISFLKAVPVLWDEMMLLDGYPGKYAVIARRSGDTWYVAGINGQKQEQTVKVELSRLTKGGTIKLITDGADSRTLIEKEYTATGGVVEVTIMPLGGFVGVVQK